MRQLVWLVVGEGEPYLRGSRINLTDKQILGRSSDNFKPDIAFGNFLISRRHCMICREDDKITLCDLGSKHGTEVNGQPLNENDVRLLQDGDTIALAKGAVTLRLVASAAWDETMELGHITAVRAQLPLVLDETRRECRIGSESITISAKEWDFLWLLYQQPGRLISYDTIKKTVWSERAHSRSIPDVGMDEINTLIYRLRRKLGEYGELIRTVRGQGCLLEELPDFRK